ncbi:MAG: outer membrane protein [Gammaproteobacteria bacterium]|nr:MAG: outer membrane protein [Gammaproteobacteria bacterium]TND02657.1 MAG: outer membrane protein [Gammaproteobacteria bacterium]
MKKNYLLPVILLTGTAFSACSTQPEKHAVLDGARSGYTEAQSNPDVTNFAAIELQQAGKALEKATNAQRKREDREVVDHLAYLAAQRVAIAQETAKLKAAEQAIANAGTEREKIRLELRTAEADSAKQQISTAQKMAGEREAALAAARSDSEAKAAETAAANARISQMEAELKVLNARKTERGMVITLGDVLFDTSKAELKDGAVNNVQKLAEFFKTYPERTAVIEGYTDSTGDSVFNQTLSEMRARAVRDVLISMGIDGNRVSTRGHGEENPVANNETAVGRQLNRRVEIVLSGDSADTAPR